MTNPFKYIFIFIALLVTSAAKAQVQPFNRHFIIVVDQTIGAGDRGMINLYHGLRSWLNGENASTYLDASGSTVPKIEPFNPNQDVISLFAFGMTGSGMRQGQSDFQRILRLCMTNKDNASVFDDIDKALIHPRDRYIDGQCIEDGSATDMGLAGFFNDKVFPLFNGSDPIHKQIKAQTGITLSHFIYPLIMRSVSKKETASEYYLIIVSDFKSGQYSNNDQEDWTIFNSLTAGRPTYRSYFESQLNALRAPFVQADFLFFKSGDVGARGTRLMHKGVIAKSQLYLGSSLDLEQESGSEFNLSKATITFDKDKLTTIDSIGVALYEGDNLLCYRTITRGEEEAEDLLADNGRDYVIPAQSSLDLGQSSLGDVTVKYIFFTMSHDADGGNVLPVSLISQQTIESSSITYVNEQLREIMTIIVLVLIVLALMALMYWRGRKKQVKARASVFAQKYTNVTKDHGTVELPCWFYVNGKTHSKIKVRGQVEKQKGMSNAGKTRLFVRLQEPKSFVFRNEEEVAEEGFNFFVNGRPCKEFTELEFNLGKNKFEFDIDISFNPEKVDPRELHHCSVMIDFKVETSLFGKVYNVDISKKPNKYEFYFIEDLGSSWVGIDPGTSGSCMSIGSPSGPLSSPSIAMVEVPTGSTTTEIIPSKIVLDHDLAGKTPANMQPGSDYKYGIKADQNWPGSIKAGMPCFQSIKKMLGYMKHGDMRLSVATSAGDLKFTGVDMASLLMKGLEFDLSSYFERLPQDDKVRLTDNEGKPRRAVVAIPNNYTLPKIQDMIESVSRLGQYKEIRFIYEPEGILFNYLRQSFKTQGNKNSETVMVFDMGGATINLSVFRVEYIHKGGTTYYNISTLGRLGYGVGGDNIDVALMEHIFKWLRLPEQVMHTAEKSDKTHILAQMLRLKLNLIYANDVYDNRDMNKMDVIYNKDLFVKFLSDLIGGDAISAMPGLVDLLDKYAEYEKNDGGYFDDFILEEFLNSTEFNDFVYSRVEDAVKEILDYPDIRPLNKIDSILFSGRSTAFPYIKETVLKTIRDRKTKDISVINFASDNDGLKTAVAYGACWYGIYNSLVTLDNSRLAGVYGFKFTSNGETKLVKLLDQNTLFDDDNVARGLREIRSSFDSDGQNVVFYQVMGSGNGNNLFSQENRFKMNELVKIRVSAQTEKVSIGVGRDNIATCRVDFETGDSAVKSDIDIDTRDIASENDWAYVFATTNDDYSGTVPSSRSRKSERKSPKTSTQQPRQSGTNKRRF